MNITVYLGSAYGIDPDFKTKIIDIRNMDCQKQSYISVSVSIETG